jgi:RNA polymerase sigma factor (sigma-70 family)
VNIEQDVMTIRGGERALTAPLSFDDLFASEHDHLYRALYFITGNAADSEELMQEAFLRLWERWDRIDEIDDPVAYLFRVALNGVRMRIRHARTTAGKLFPTHESFDPYDEIDLHEDVRRMLLGLPPRQRAAIVLTEIFGYSSEQAGRILRIRPTTVRVLASQGRAALRRR